MTARLRYRDDSGAYAILYALLLLVMLGMAALVVDLGALRQNRRETRLAADAAATAGARQLDLLSGTANPQAACTEAWSYLATNLGFDVASAATGCGALPASASSAACPATVTSATGTVGSYTVVVTWPVPDTSPLMTDPDVRPAAAGGTTQAVDPAVDGTDPCARIGVTVQEEREPAFASVFGTGTTSTVVTSVARSTSSPGVGGPIAALNVLEQTACDAVLTDGQGSIEISAVGTRPGMIAVESSGRPGGGSCPNNAPWVVNVAVTSSGGHVWANGPTGNGTGTILSYALNAAPAGNPAQAFNPGTVPPGSTLLMPRPTVMSQRFGAKPVTDIYDCVTGCATGGGTYRTQLVAAYNRDVPAGYAGSPVPYRSLPFRTVSAATVTGWPGCTIGGGDVVLVPAGNWYVDCDSLVVRGTLVFAGGNVVVRGRAGQSAINVSSFGCLAMNVPLVAVASCPTRNAAGQVVPAATAEAILFVRAGNVSKGAQASLFTERTFVYLNNGVVSLGGGGTGTLYMTNPRPSPVGCAAACQAARFGKLSMWSPSTGEQSIGGQANVYLQGVVFVPNSPFTYSGGSAIVQTNAQFWTRTIKMSGQGVLRMAPDPSDAVERPELSTALIR